MSGPAGRTSIAAHGDGLLLVNDVLEERQSALQLPAVDGLGGLAGVLERDTEVRPAGASRLRRGNFSRSVPNLNFPFPVSLGPYTGFDIARSQSAMNPPIQPSISSSRMSLKPVFWQFDVDTGFVRVTDHLDCLSMRGRNRPTLGLRDDGGSKFWRQIRFSRLGLCGHWMIGLCGRIWPQASAGLVGTQPRNRESIDRCINS